MDSKGIRRHRACPLRCRRRLVGVSIYVFLLALGIASLKLLPWYHGNGQQPLASQIQHEVGTKLKNDIFKRNSFMLDCLSVWSRYL